MYNVLGILADSTMYNVLVLCCTWLGFILSYTAKNRQACLRVDLRARAAAAARF